MPEAIRASSRCGSLYWQAPELVITRKAWVFQYEAKHQQLTQELTCITACCSATVCKCHSASRVHLASQRFCAEVTPEMQLGNASKWQMCCDGLCCSIWEVAASSMPCRLPHARPARTMLMNTLVASISQWTCHPQGNLALLRIPRAGPS